MAGIKSNVIFYFLLASNTVHSHTLSKIKDLKQELFMDYDATILPLSDQPLNITVGFKIRSIVSADVVSGQLVLRGYVAATWRDECLAWNKSEVGIEWITVRDDEIWVPNFIFTQPVSGEMTTTLKLLSSGHVIMVMIGNIETHCDLNMRYYPMDAHSCGISLMCGSYSKNYVRLSSNVSGITDLILPHGEWTIDEPFVTNEIFIEPFTDKLTDVIKLTVLLSRRYEFNVLHKIAPQCLLMFANIFIHIVPIDSGERVSFSATIFLSFVFWQTIVIDDLPQNSAKISYYSIILTICMVLSTISLLTSICLSRMAVETDKPIPRSLRDAVVYVRHKKRKEKKKEQLTEEIDTVLSNLSNIIKDDITGSNDPNQNDTKNGKTNDEGQSLQPDRARDVNFAQTNKADTEVTWLDVANLIDATFFCSSIVFILLFGCVFSVLFLFV